MSETFTNGDPPDDCRLNHALAKWFIRNRSQLNRFLVWTDDLFGYGKMSDPRKCWDIP
jgi:hypothetical protein